MSSKSASMKQSPGNLRPWLCWISVLGALALTLLRMAPDENQYVALLCQALLHPESLSGDPVVRAASEAPYTLAPKALAWMLARVVAGTGLGVGWPIAMLQLLLWAAQAHGMYRLASAVSGREDAALLATLFFGLDMPLTFADAPYSMQFLERSLGMVPLLWGLRGLVQGRHWTAVAGIGSATYLHANPAIYLWPLLLLELALSAWRDPRERPGAVLRAAAALGLALPLLKGAGLKPFPDDPEFVRLTLISHAPWIAGASLSAADYVFFLQGCALVALAAWRGRGLPGTPLLIRAMGVCLAMLALGSVAHRAYAIDSILWGVPVKMQPWIGLYVLDWAGQLLLAAWLATEIRESAAAWPCFLLALSVSSYRDFVMRFAGVCMGACGLLGWSRLAAAVAAGAALTPLLYRLSPGTFQAAAAGAGLRGGLFSLPAFAPAVGVGMAACLALGWRLNRKGAGHGNAADEDGPPRAWPGLAAAAALMLGVAAVRGRPAGPAPREDLERMADWVREHTPPDAVLLAAPLDLVGPAAGFMARSERSLFAYGSFVHGAMMYGEAGGPMLGRLRELGFEPERVQSVSDLHRELRRVDLDLSPERLRGLARSGRAGYLLLRSGRAWPGEPLHRDGGLSIYRL